MRILFLTRTLPHRALGATETRLNDRLCELSELGHDVLVLTKWTGESLDFDFPSRIEIRSPFKTFRAWEWPKALPMVFSWRPDLLHVYDAGLSAIDRSLSVEMMAITMLETLKRTSRGRTNYRGGLVSLDPKSESKTAWKNAGARFIEDEWLRAGESRFVAKPWDGAADRPLQLVLAGRIGTEVSIDLVIDALERMRQVPDFELTVFLERSRLSVSQKERLARAERAVPRSTTDRNTFEDQKSLRAVGARLKLVEPGTLGEIKKDHFDALLVLGLKPGEAGWWLERFPLPVVLSENLKPIALEIEARGAPSQILGPLVSDVAPVAQALALATDRSLLQMAWSRIETDILSGRLDVAANHVSRLYSQIARSASPS